MTAGQIPITESVTALAKKTKAAALFLSQSDEKRIQLVLRDLAKRLRDETPHILSSNRRDLENARKNGLSDALVDRLMLDDNRLEAIASSVEAIADLPCPVGRKLWKTTRPNGMNIQRVSVPIGVLGIIYESRPNVTIDAAALCIKSRNAAILRGGSESFYTATALHRLIQDSLEAADIERDAISMIDTTSREAVDAMLECDRYIDVIVPRGGKGLVDKVMREARMPVFGHREGLCHVFIHRDADINMAIDIVVNSKLRRTGICGAAETLLLDKGLDINAQKAILNALLDRDCVIHGDSNVQKIDTRIKPASDQDWSTEYLSAQISAALVDDVDGAIAHINDYGSQHTESIVTNNLQVAQKFQACVDSGIVMHNVSTQFADGGEFGMGAEIGIATGKMHARGPVGLEQLCSYKYHVCGSGQTRS